MRKRISLALAVLTLAVCVVGSLAYFTDRIEASAQATAGTLDLTLSTITAANASDLKPGYGSTITYTVTNIGNKSADVKETMVLNVGAVMTEGNPEFKLYPAGAVALTNGKVTATPGTALTGTLSADKKSISFDLGEFILSGKNTVGKTDAEIEYTGDPATAIANYKDQEFILVFCDHADNDFQELNLTMYYLAEAKQHRNTNSDTWTSLEKTEINFAGGKTQAVLSKSES